MTIIQLITGLGGGGAEHVVLELAKAAHSRKQEVQVIVVSDVREIEQKFLDAGIEPYYLHINGFKQLFSGLRRLNHVLRDIPEPVVHCHMFHAYLVALLYKLRYGGVKLVFTLHNNVVKSAWRRILMFGTKAFRQVDVIFTENSKKWYLKNNAVIPNGIDLSKFACERAPYTYSPQAPPFKFLFLGSLTEQKNPLFLPELARYLLDQGITNFIIQVVGGGPMKQSLLEAIEKLNVQEKITLFGFRNDAEHFLKTAHCLIMPSHWEGMPVSIIEAGAARLPVLVTPVGSIPDFLNAQNAYVVSLDRFKQQMKHVIQNYGEALQKGDALYSFVNANFSINSVFDKTLKIYQACAGS